MMADVRQYDIQNMSLKKERARFEEWTKSYKDVICLNRYRKRKNSTFRLTYVYYNTQCLWDAWCAALGIKEEEQ